MQKIPTVLAVCSQGHSANTVGRITLSSLSRMTSPCICPAADIPLISSGLKQDSAILIFQDISKKLLVFLTTNMLISTEQAMHAIFLAIQTLLLFNVPLIQDTTHLEALTETSGMPWSFTNRLQTKTKNNKLEQNSKFNSNNILYIDCAKFLC